MYVKKIIFGTLLHVAVKMETFWQMLWIIQRLRVMKLYDKETKTIPTNEKKATCKTQNYNFLLAFVLITKALLIDVSVYSSVIKYQAKQKHLLPFHLASYVLIIIIIIIIIIKISNKVKDIDIKNHTYYFFDDIINLKNFDANNIKIE